MKMTGLVLTFFASISLCSCGAFKNPETQKASLHEDQVIKFEEPRKDQPTSAERKEILAQFLRWEPGQSGVTSQPHEDYAVSYVYRNRNNEIVAVALGTTHSYSWSRRSETVFIHYPLTNNKINLVFKYERTFTASQHADILGYTEEKFYATASDSLNRFHPWNAYRFCGYGTRKYHNGSYIEYRTYDEFCRGKSGVEFKDESDLLAKVVKSLAATISAESN